MAKSHRLSFRDGEVEDKSEETTGAEKKSRRSFVSRKMVPKVKKSASAADQSLLTSNEKLKDRWYIKGLIGKGGYGQIYLALDMKLTGDVAVKAEPKKKKDGKVAKRMILESTVLQIMQGRPHVPKMFAAGQEQDINFIVMELLSVNLGDLRKQSPVRRLSKSTVARVTMQAIGALRDIHTAYFLHRDVKPENMCFGITLNTRHILMLVDYGLVRKFKRSNGELIPSRRKAGFRGTSRYVSIRVHDKLEQSPADDLVSLAYSSLELMVGDLPWKFKSKEELKRSKQEIQSDDASSMLKAVPEAMEQFCRAVFKLQFGDEPNYKYIQDILASLTGGRKLSDPYDWDEEYKEAIEDCATLSEGPSEQQASN